MHLRFGGFLNHKMRYILPLLTTFEENKLNYITFKNMTFTTQIKTVRMLPCSLYSLLYSSPNDFISTHP